MNATQPVPDAERARLAFENLSIRVRRTLRHDFAGKLSDGDLGFATSKALSELTPDAAVPTWDEAPIFSLEALHRVASLGKPARVQARIVERSSTHLMRRPDRETGTDHLEEVVTITLEDRKCGRMETLDVSGPDLIDKIDKALRAGTFVDVLGFVVPLPIPPRGKKQPALGVEESRQRMCFSVVDVRASTSQLDLVSATATERADASSVLEGLRHMGLSAVDYLRWQIVALLGIVGLDEFPQLDLLVRFVILQALSTGTIDHTSASLHGIVIGPPGRGKKLLGLVAKLLHATCVELSPSKVSLAGLVGAASHDRSGWKSSPGALARASLGVVHLQDAHCWSPSMVRMLAPVLQEVMEDGVTRDSVAGGLTRETQTALLIDLNRNEHVGLAGETPFLAARPLPSRADLLSEIPPDARQSWKVGRQMFGGGGQGGPLDDTNPNVRALRVLVAALRDRIPVVHLGPALPRMQELYGQIEVNYADMIDSDPEAGDVPTRMTVSMKRFAAAAARAGQRTEAIAADAEAAMPFLEMKLKFLQSRSKTKKSVSPIGVDEFLRGVGPGPFRSAALAEQYTAATGECCSERTMRRGLRAAGARRVGKGEYALDNWTSGQANDGSDGEKP